MNNGGGGDRNGKVLQDILIHVGKTSEGITNLKEDVRDVKDHLMALNDAAVRKDECTQRHVIVAQSIDSVRGELKSDLSEIKKDLKFVRSKTREDNPAITPKMLAAGEEYEESAPESKGLKYWLGVAGGTITVLSFLGAIIWGVFKVGRYMERVDQGLAKQAKQQLQIQAQVKQAAQPRIIHVYPDIGAMGPEPPPEPKKKAPRRRRRPAYRNP